jgi:hypothetical protein
VLLAHLLSRLATGFAARWFSRSTKHGADRVAEQLQRAGASPPLPSTATRAQGARVRALEDFKNKPHHRVSGRDRQWPRAASTSRNVSLTS